MSDASRLHGRLDYKWLVVISVTLGMFMSMMDGTIVNVAIPRLRAVFGGSLQQVQWVVTIYMITQAAVIPTAPYLATKFGSKRAWICTLVAFLLGSILCGFAWNLPSLIFFRMIQGIGGGVLLPMVMTLLYQAFPPEERGTASSMMSVPLMAAPIMGPVLGGYLVTVFSWRWAFFINIPMGVVALMFAQKALKQSQPQPQTRFDAPGFLTIASGSVTLLAALSALTGGRGGIGGVVLLAVALLLLYSFVGIEGRKIRSRQNPLLDLRRFHDRTFSFSVLTLILFSFVYFGVLFFIPIYLQTLRHKSALEAGTIQAAQAVAMLITLPIAGRLADRKGPRSVVLAGLVVLVGAVLLLRTLGLSTPIVGIVGMLFLMGVASALTGQVPVAAMSRIKKEEHKEVANGSTLVSVLRATAAPMGVGVLSSFAQAQTRHFTHSLSAQGVVGDLLTQQSSLLAMRASFLVAAVLALAALAAMSFVPKRRATTPLAEASDLI